MPERRAIAQSSRTGSRMPLTFEAWVSARTRVLGVSAWRNGAINSSGPEGLLGTATVRSAKPRRRARTAQATLLVGWFWSQITTSSPGPSSSPSLTILFPSLVLRTSAISSVAAPNWLAMAERAVSRSRANRSRFWKEQSTSIERVNSVTASATLVGEGHRFAAFIGTRSSRNGNCSRTACQYPSSGAAAGTGSGRTASADAAATPPRNCRLVASEIMPLQA